MEFIPTEAGVINGGEVFAEASKEETGNDDSSSSEDTIDDDGTGFAARLRKHRRQVLEKDAPNGFATALKKHRDHLVDSWEDHPSENGGVVKTHLNGSSKNGEDDVFGSTPIPSVNQSLKEKGFFGGEAPAKEQEDLGNEDDFFGDFAAAIDSRASSVPAFPEATTTTSENCQDMTSADPCESEQTKHNCEPMEEDDDFGDFDAAPSMPAVEPENDEEEDFGGFENAPVSLEIIEGKGAVIGNGNSHHDNPTEASFDSPTPIAEESLEEDNFFGDFQATDVAETTGALAEPMDPLHAESGSFQPGLADVDENDFGDFDAAPTQTGPSGTAAISVTNDDEAFGDFDAAPTQIETQTFANVVPGDVENEALFDNGAAPVEAKPPSNTADADDEAFSDFDAPPTQPDESTSANNVVGNDDNDDDNAFGGFDSATTEPPSNPIDTAEDDGFGIFETAPKQYEHLGGNDDEKDENDELGGLTAAMEKSDEAEEDDFGDFDGATEKADLVSELEEGNLVSLPIQSDSAPPDDNFGDFDTAPNQSNPSKIEDDDNLGVLDVLPVQSEQTSNVKGEVDDGFGAFDAAPSVVAQPTVAKEDNDEDDFGDFDAAPLQSEQPPPGAEGEDDDGFGDFDAAPTAIKQKDGDDGFGTFDAAPLQREETSNGKEDDNDDDFGDFDAAPAQLEKLPDAEGEDDDDFGNFDAAPMPLNKEDGDDEFGAFDAATPLHEEGDDNEDDFGDFDTAPPQPEETSNAEEDDNDDDFGDFDAAPAQLETSPDAEGEDEDDFGDFDTAPPQSRKSINNEKEDDDFGDFDAAPSLPIAGDNDVDGFGNFDAAPTSAEPQIRATEEEDNGFGDFDAAPANVEQTKPDKETDGFGNFDAAPSQQESSDPDGCDFGNFDRVSQYVAPLVPTAKINDETRTLFAKMQVIHSFPDVERYEPSVVKGRKNEVDSISSFLLSINATSLNEDSLETDHLVQFLRGAPPTEDSGSSELATIIVEDGRGPHDCFIYPLTGCHPPQSTVRKEKALGRQSSIRAIPDVLPIRLPSGREMPLDTASPVSSSSKAKISNGPIKALDLPSLETASDSTRKMEQFRLRIPDLSFMLQSKLQLPAK